MDELKKLNNNQYAYLRQLPIGKLLKLLAVAPVPASCPEDEAYIDALEEAIIEKEEENPTGFFPNVDQQWEQFVTHYLPGKEDTALEPERTEYSVSVQTNQQFLEVPPKRVVQFRRVWRTALAAAAAIACVFAIMVMAQAAGADVFGAMAQWTEDVFSFGRIPSDSVVSDSLGEDTAENRTELPDSEQEFSSFQAALDAYGMTEVHEPTWLPEGYALDEINAVYLDDPLFMTFYASYMNGGNYIGIDIKSYEGEPITLVQKTDAPVETIEKNGITFYFVKNTVGGTLMWYTDQYEYYLSAKEGKDILWQIVESMLG